MRLLGVAAAICVAGCSVYDQSLLEGDGSGAQGGASGAAGGGGTPTCPGGSCWWQTTTADGCGTVSTPPTSHPDPALVEAGVDEPPIYTALEEVFTGTRQLDRTPFDPNDPNAIQPFTTFGLDLDGTCTNVDGCGTPAGAASCQYFPGPMVPFDGDLCRDNTFARLQPVAAAVPDLAMLGIVEADINCLIWNGQYTNFTRITGWNGTPEDDQVRLDYYRSTGLTLPAGWECPLDGFADKFPKWLSSAPWRIVEDDLVGPVTAPGELPESIWSDPNAYVHQGFVVGRFPENTPFHLPGDNALFPGFKVTLNGVIWVARPERQQDGTWRLLDGLVTGRFRSADLIQSFNDIGFCDDSPLYTGFLSFIEQNADVLADGANDPGRPCDSMSVGIAFTSGSATPGPAVPLAPPPGCPVGGGGSAGQAGGPGAGAGGGGAGASP